MFPNGAEFALSLTFDVEMCTNFPYWTSQWNHRKGAIDEDSKLYMGKMLDVAEKYGVKLQFFLVGTALEDPNIDYLIRMVAEGHAVDNHTYHHVNVKAQGHSAVAARVRQRAVAGRRPERLGVHPPRGAADLSPRLLKSSASRPPAFALPAGSTTGWTMCRQCKSC